VRLTPTDEWKSAISGAKATKDFFEYFDSLDYSKAQSDGIPLFDIRAAYDPSDTRPIDEDLPVIGTIRLTSELHRSTFGDERLFFQHESFGRDILKIRD